MTTSMGAQLTPGQKCLLDLLQRKLLSTIQSYAKLSLESHRQIYRNEHEHHHVDIQNQQLKQQQDIENELKKLKEKIRRISARQKRFTLEIINGNGNNTIPKESFFQALGLVTKEALSRLNSKSNERRRRTTANPRFSHEAIQAKRALEPLHKRLEPKSRDNKRETSRRPQRNNTINNNNNNNNNNNTTNNNNQRVAQQSRNKQTSNQFSLQKERNELLNQYGNLQIDINRRVSQIMDKRESNRQLEKQIELMRKRGLDLVNAIQLIDPSVTFLVDEENNGLGLMHLIKPDLIAGNDRGMVVDSCKAKVMDLGVGQKAHRRTNTTGNKNNKNTTTNNNQIGSNGEPLDVWIDMKCDESLDGLD